MELDQETLVDCIQKLSKTKFKAICQCLLREYFNLDAINVDGSGDGGADWITIPYGVGKRSFVAQDTSQLQNWEDKCRKDAENAYTKLQCTKFIFLTSRKHHNTTLHALETEIQYKYDIPASCLGATEIAGILRNKQLVKLALTEAGLHIEFDKTFRLDRTEALLYGSIAFSQEAKELRDLIFDDAILFYLSEQTSGTKEAIIAGVGALLQCSEERLTRLKGRIDSLLSKKVLVYDPTEKRIGLSPEMTTDIAAARDIYAAQRNNLKESIELLLREKHKSISLSDQETTDIAIYVSRYTVLQSLQGTKAAGITIHAIPIIEQFGSPLEDLMKLLAPKIGSRKAALPLIEEAVNQSALHPMVLRLFRSVLYFAMDGVNTAYHARIFGSGNWTDVQVLLDASVAIPVLCSKLTETSIGRFSRGATIGINRLDTLGCSITIPKQYINECAVHLIHALSYCIDFSDSSLLSHSTNGYVSHYYSLRNSGREVPKSLVHFLTLISPALKNPQEPNLVTRVMHDIEGHLSVFGISRLNFEHVPDSFYHVVRTTYEKTLKTRLASRDTVPMEHDLDTVAWMCKQHSEGKYGLLCLTWDNLLIAVARELDNAGWFLTPHQISDLISAGSSRDEHALLSATHDLSEIRTIEDRATGKLLDRLVELLRAKKIEWKVIEDLKAFRQHLHEISSRDGAPSEKDLKKEEWSFLKKHGVEPSEHFERKEISVEDIEKVLAQM